MNKRLEELFDLPQETQQEMQSPAESTGSQDLREKIVAIDATIDKIDTALPQVRGLDATDREMDELADMAASSYRELMDLGMQVDSRFASDIFSVASNMLGHAITAKTAKMDKKLKMIDLQLKKMRLDQSQPQEQPVTTQGTGMVLSRNDLLERILGNNQNAKKE
jgi:hypothetical protein